jgi:Pro-kumamolisin, activation domain
MNTQKKDRPQQKLPLEGSARPQPAGATRTGPVKDDEMIRFTILLRPRADSPAFNDFDHWQRTSPDIRSFLSVDSFLRQYGASGEEFDAVADFLRSYNIRITEGQAERRRIEAEGTAADISKAFDITLNTYKAPFRFPKKFIPGQGDQNSGDSTENLFETTERMHRGFEGVLHVPANISDIITAVIGLDNRRMGGPAIAGTGDPAISNFLSPAGSANSIAELYRFPKFPATGQTVALFEAANGGAAYLHADINQYIASLPAGFNTPPNLTDIGLLGNTNNPALVTSGPPFPDGVYETVLDVAVVAAVAQGVNINVYFTDDSELGWEAFFHRAILPLPGDNPPSVISASWILTISDDIGTIGAPTTVGTLSWWLTAYLQLAAMRGITVFMALGDWGSANLNSDGAAHVSFPNSDPWLTSCGGTIIGDITVLPSVNFEEFTWSDANRPSPFQSFPYVATGGGVSDTFPIPPYQVAAGLLPVSKNDGGVRRGLPDVAGMIAMDGFFIKGNGGPGQNALIGTSAVSPFYAGLIAMINAILGRSTGFLNPTLYKYGLEICNDITFGDNYSGVPAPFYQAGFGWDMVTGWGSINGNRLLAAIAPAPILETALAQGEFKNTCVGSFTDEILTINNSGFSTLLVKKIISSLPDFLVPTVVSFPLAVSPGGSIDVVIRFKPLSPGIKIALLEIFSNDLSPVHAIILAGTGEVPRLVLGIADSGNFGKVCAGSFRDEPLVLNNGSMCTLSVSSISSSSPEFLAPSVVSFPVLIAGGNSLEIPIRFAPAGTGLKNAVITVESNDPGGARFIPVSGEAPAGKLVVTGSTFFGGVKACCGEERTISICNVGDCKLQILGVAFRRKSRHWKLIHNPFPAALHPGSCLSLVILYKASEKCPRSQELVITSNDPSMPVKYLDLLAYTVWDECGCEKKHDKHCGCDKCRNICCDEDDHENEGDK